MQENEPEFYKPFDNNDFQFERCFLCGCDFDEAKQTDEHVFPKWLLRRFDLYNETLNLFNHSTISYRHLKIPCCAGCNGTYLSQMEDKFRGLLSRDFQKLSDTDELVVFQWAAKILYGTLYKELSLLNDQRVPESGTIMTPYTVERFRTLHLLLQSIRIPTAFRKPYPWSIFVFNYEGDDFHYINDIEHQSFAIKLGTIGVTVVFEDSGAVGRLVRWMHGLKAFKLNPLQFIEASAIIFYGKRLMINSITYMSAYSISQKEMVIKAMNEPRGRDWDREEYAAFFNTMLVRDGYEDFGTLYVDDTVRTWLADENGVLMMDIIRAEYNDDFGINFS